jgi:hypothetical protein
MSSEPSGELSPQPELNNSSIGMLSTLSKETNSPARRLVQSKVLLPSTVSSSQKDTSLTRASSVAKLLTQLSPDFELEAEEISSFRSFMKTPSFFTSTSATVNQKENFPVKNFFAS